MNTIPASDPSPTWESTLYQHWEALYPELRRVAQRLMRQERADHTWSATGLVHEVFLRILSKSAPAPQAEAPAPACPTDEAASLEVPRRQAVRVMRHLLIDHARARGAQQRGGDWSRVTWSAAEQVAVPPLQLDVLVLEAALQSLESLDPRAAQVLELRVFGGLSVEECAQTLGLSPATVKRDWLFARGHLAQHADLQP